jgi:hypothetical protein
VKNELFGKILKNFLAERKTAQQPGEKRLLSGSLGKIAY